MVRHICTIPLSGAEFIDMISLGLRQLHQWLMRRDPIKKFPLLVQPLTKYLRSEERKSFETNMNEGKS